MPSASQSAGTEVGFTRSDNNRSKPFAYVAIVRQSDLDEMSETCPHRSDCAIHMEPFVVNEMVMRLSCCSVVVCVQCFLSYIDQSRADLGRPSRCIKCRKDLAFNLLASMLLDSDAPGIEADNLDVNFLNFVSRLDVRRTPDWLRIDIDPVEDSHFPPYIFGRQSNQNTPVISSSPRDRRQRRISRYFGSALSEYQQPTLVDHIRAARMYADDSKMGWNLTNIPDLQVTGWAVARGLAYHITCEPKYLVCTLEAIRDAHKLLEWAKSHHNHAEPLSLYFKGTAEIHVFIVLGDHPYAICVEPHIVSGRFANRCIVREGTKDGRLEILKSEHYSKAVQRLIFLMLLLLSSMADGMMSDEYDWGATWQSKGEFDFVIKPHMEFPSSDYE